MSGKPFDDVQDPESVAGEMRAVAAEMQAICPCSASRAIARAEHLQRAPHSEDAWRWLEARGDCAAADVLTFRAARRSPS